MGESVDFGVQFHGMWAAYTDAERAVVLDQIKASGTEWVRLDVGWEMIQPREGSYDLAWGVPFVDRVIAMARARGLKVLVTFWRTPAWANGGQSAVTLPSDPGDFAAAARWAAERWAGVVDHWEVWNEPNLSHYMAGADVSDYVELLCATYPAIKAGNPEATVIFGGTLYSDDEFIARAYRAGAKGCFDAMAIHPYVAPGNASPLARGTGERYDFDNIAAVRRVMLANNDPKEIWATEFGWSSHANTASTEPWNLGVSLADQARYAVQALEELNRSYPYVTKAFWYNEHDLSTGAVHHDNFGLLTKTFTPKPVWYALRTFLTTTPDTPPPLARRQTTIDTRWVTKPTTTRPGKVTVNVRGTAVRPTGKVVVRLVKHGVVKRTTNKALRQGAATVWMPKLSSGPWRVRIRYLGSSTYFATTKVLEFRVARP